MTYEYVTTSHRLSKNGVTRFNPPPAKGDVTYALSHTTVVGGVLYATWSAYKHFVVTEVLTGYEAKPPSGHADVDGDCG